MASERQSRLSASRVRLSLLLDSRCGYFPDFRCQSSSTIRKEYKEKCVIPKDTYDP